MLLEKVILAALKQGDKNAFSYLFTAYYRDLVLFADRLLHNSDSSEEIVQDLFVRIWEDRESLDIRFSFKSYLLKSVRNRCIDSIRHHKVREDYYGTSRYRIDNLDFSTDNYILDSELEIALTSALKKLPAELSESFRMHRQEGLKYAEIAEKLNVSVRTIEVRMGKALNLLREELREFLD